MSKLTPDRVEELFRACLRNEGTVVEGVVNKAYLDATGHENDIAELLAELPDPFRAEIGGGWSFLQACERRDGTQWTGLHQTVDKLFMLGIAAGKAKWLMPREMWSAFPGSVPYVVVTLS